jgi:3-methyladenine DNA glycosylase AlkC
VSRTEDDLLRQKERELLKKISEPEEFAKGLQAMLRLAGDEERQGSYQRIIPQMGETYGTPIPVLRIVASEIGKLGQRNPDQVFPVLGLLLRNGSFEKGLSWPKAWRRSLGSIHPFIGDISDWTICDKLAMFGIKPLITKHAVEILSLCEKWAQDGNKWVRRFGTVASYSLAEDENYQLGKREFLLLELLMEDRDTDVKKAVAWILREMSKGEPVIAFEFLVDHAEAANKDTRWIIKEGSKKLSIEDREGLLSFF